MPKIVRPSTGAVPAAEPDAGDATRAAVDARPAASPASVREPVPEPEPAVDPAGVPEIEVRVSTFRHEPEQEKPKRGQIPARASYYLNTATGELRNRGGHGWVELTVEQTAVAEVLPQRTRPAWWRQQVRTGDAGR